MPLTSPSSPRARRPVPTRPSARTVFALSRLDLARVLVALVVSALAVAAFHAPRADAVEPLSPELRGLAQGVDTSNWQHPNGADVNWGAAARSGKSFAFIKATEGTAPYNDYYEDDVRDARAAGMVIGSYHKARPGMDAAAQARAFAKTLQSVGGRQLPPVLDIEIDEGRSPAQLIDWTRTFLTETKRLTGRTPLVYTYRYFWITKMANTSEFTSYPLWIAEYNQSEPTFPLVGGWDEWTFWQRAGDDGSSPGFPGAVDLDVFAGDTNDLKSLVGPVSPGAGADKTPTKPAQTAPAAKGDVTIGGSSVPTKITIPAIPGITLPPGIRLPMTVTLPTQSATGAPTDLHSALTLAQSAGLLDRLPAEVLKAARFS